jgi:hypothetical protein
MGNKMKEKGIDQNLPSNFRLCTNDSEFRELEHQQAVRCKATRVPARRISHTPQGEGIEGNTADDASMVEQGMRLAR